MSKTIDTVADDIYALFDPNEHHEPSSDNLEQFCQNLKDLIRRRLAKNEERNGLRFSNLGKPDRQLWYATHQPELAEPLTGKQQFKFLYGDIIEQIVLLLAKEAGHSVEAEQQELEVDGVVGHIDCVLDGVVCDVKSASPMAFRKFSTGSLFTDDPFGYIGQLSGYAETLTPDAGGAFLAVDKVSGDIAVLRVGASITSTHKPGPRIAHLRQVLDNPSKPERCYSDVEDGKSGNRKLGTNCGYCAFKSDCWSDANDGTGLRTFFYSGGPRFLTQVEREPDVPERARSDIA